MRSHVDWWRAACHSPSSLPRHFCTIKHMVFAKSTETEIVCWCKTIHFLQESCMGLKVWCSAFAINNNDFALFHWLLTPSFFSFAVFLQSLCGREAQHEGVICGWGCCLLEAKIILLLKVFIEIVPSVMNHRSDKTMKYCYFCFTFHSNSVASLFFLWLVGACCIFCFHCFLNTFSRFYPCDEVCIQVGQWCFYIKVICFYSHVAPTLHRYQSWTKQGLGTFYWFLQCVRHLFRP